MGNGRVWIFFALVLATAALDRLASPACGQERHVHLLILADTSEEDRGGRKNRAAPGCKIDVDLVRTYFDQNAPHGRLVVEPPVVGRELTKQNVLNAIAGVDAKGETLVVYFSGHGSYAGRDTRQPRAELSKLKMPFGYDHHISRSELRVAMLGRDPRLAVLITDMCSNLSTFEPPKPDSPWSYSTPNVVPLFEELFLKPYGLVVDVCATKPPEVGYGDSKNGGFFTCSLLATLGEKAAQRLPWKDTLALVQTEVTNIFRDEDHPRGRYNSTTGKYQQTQTVHAYSLLDPSTFTNSIGMKMVRIPGGVATLGKENSSDYPLRTVRVEPFFMGAHEVTVGQFRKFVEATRYYPKAKLCGRAKTTSRNFEDRV